MDLEQVCPAGRPREPLPRSGQGLLLEKHPEPGAPGSGTPLCWEFTQGTSWVRHHGLTLAGKPHRVVLLPSDRVATHRQTDTDTRPLRALLLGRGRAAPGAIPPWHLPGQMLTPRVHTVWVRGLGTPRRCWGIVLPFLSSSLRHREAVSTCIVWAAATRGSPLPGFPWIRLSGILLRTQPGGTGVTLPLPWSSGGSTASHTICSLEQAEPLLQHLIPCLKAALLPPQQLLHCPSSLQLLAGLHLPSFLTPPELLSTSGQAQHQHLPPLRGAFGLILLHRGPWSQGHLDVSPAGERNPDVGYRNGMERVESSLRWRHTHKPEQISLFFEQSRFL